MRGDHGFGFDKVFMPNGQTKTYAEMSAKEKDAVSHRSKAITNFIKALTAYQSDSQQG
jgi:XTP/dITP diphosphohydrolase